MEVENKATEEPTMHGNSSQELVSQPGKHDVLLGRGGGMNNHSGNIKFRNLVSEHRVRYLIASKVDKPQVAREVVGIWRRLKPRGRFLMRASQSMRGPGSVKAADTVWYDVGDLKAREKASQCLRERTPELMPLVKHLNENPYGIPEEDFGDILRYVKMQQEAREREAQAIPQASPQRVQDFGQHQQVDLMKQNHVMKQLNFSESSTFPECAPAISASPQYTTMMEGALASPRQPLPVPTEHTFMEATPHQLSRVSASYFSPNDRPSGTGTVHTLLTPRRDPTFDPGNGCSNNRLFGHQQTGTQMKPMQLQLQEKSGTALQHAALYAFSQEEQRQCSNVDRNDALVNQFDDRPLNVAVPVTPRREVADAQQIVSPDSGVFDFHQNWMQLNQMQASGFCHPHHNHHQQQQLSTDNGSVIGMYHLLSDPFPIELAPMINMESADESADESAEWTKIEGPPVPSIQGPMEPLTLDQELTIDSYREQLNDYLDKTESSFWVTGRGPANEEYESDLEDDWEQERDKSLERTLKTRDLTMDCNASGISFMSTKTTESHTSIVSSVNASVFSNAARADKAQESKVGASRSVVSILSEITFLSENLDKLLLEADAPGVETSFNLQYPETTCAI